MIRLLLTVCLCLFGSMAQATGAVPVKRQLIAFFDSREESTPRLGMTHRFLEMPTNHLGYDIRYIDITKPLPEISDSDNVYGVILWFYGAMEVVDADSYMKWLLEAQKQGKKIVLIGNMGLTDKQLNSPDIMSMYQRFMLRLGIRDKSIWNPLTYGAEIEFIDKGMVGFERDYGLSLPPFRSTHALANAVSYLRVNPGNGNEPADLVITSPYGGYVAEDYMIYTFYSDENIILTGKKPYEITQWYVNPFKFLRTALDVPHAPVPDVTTLNGRRIFYSHIDGDGWNSLSEVAAYRDKKVISAEVMMNEILKPYEDFPFTVGVITSDLDTSCYGLPHSADIARQIYALPNVEPSSHTHSHPLFWRFFADYEPEKERPFLAKYPPKPRDNRSLYSAATAYLDNPNDKYRALRHHARKKTVKLGRVDPTDEEMLKDSYDTPRSFACTPYDLQQEISGSIEIVNRLVPDGKKAVLVQWSGNTAPYEEALKAVREAGLLNINGGDSRFDREYPSYAWVAPIGIQIGKQRQIYSSNSNENTYTNLWTARFFGFRYLQSTVENTESPMRISPFNVYFHMYSAEKDASLKALKDNLEFARTQSVIPIETSQYARIAESFYTTRITQLSDQRWQVHDRGELQTLRLDNPNGLTIDMQRSEGVLGYNIHQDSIYVSLDPSAESPIISLTNNNNIVSGYRNASLVDSRFQIKGLQKDKNSLTFTASGYGEGEMTWRMAPDSQHNISITRGTEILFTSTAAADKQGVLHIYFKDINTNEPFTITLTQHLAGT
ncbi:MAG: hypothetical protein AB7L92_04650 [Alphaproteobacteria bacterium]